MRSPSIIMACALVVLGASPVHGATGDGKPARGTDAPARRDQRESLQEFLVRLRAHRDGLISELRNGVDAILRTMDLEAQSHHVEGLADGKTRLVALGPECATLLVPQIDPGANASDAAKLRAAYVTQALVELAARAVTNDVIAIARDGTLEGRINAVKVLASSPEPERTGPVLVGIFRGNTAELRGPALVALAKIPGPDSEKVLSDALGDASPEIVRPALEAVTVAKNASVAPRVAKLLSATHESSGFADAFVAYYRACPESVDKPTVAALVRMAGEYSASNESRIRVLELLPSFADRFDVEHRKELKQIAESPVRELHEAALETLYLVGDKNARRELLQEYDTAIERNKTWPSSYEARANVLYKLHDWREAMKDYQKALQLSVGDIHAHTEESYIGLARCYAQTGKLKEAAQNIEKAPVSMKRLAELAKEPAFAKLAENPKYRGVFKIE
jgi:tetratricopeptide (TPR) repeat protein